MAGECYAFVSDAHPNRDIQNSSLLKGPGFDCLRLQTAWAFSSPPANV